MIRHGVFTSVFGLHNGTNNKQTLLIPGETQTSVYNLTDVSFQVLSSVITFSNTVVELEYGTESGVYTNTVTAAESPLLITGNVNFTLTGLIPFTDYYFRIKATNSLRTKYTDEYIQKTNKQVIQSTLMNGLVSIYEMEVLINDICPDSFGENHGIITNCIQTAGKLGYGIIANGAGANVNLGNNIPLGENQDFTISLWLQSKATNSYLKQAITNRSGVSPNVGMMLYFENRTGLNDSNGLNRTNSFCWSIDTGPSYLTVTTGQNSIPQVAGAWHHVVMYRSDNKMGIILNNGTANEYTNDALRSNLISNSPLKLFIDFTNTYIYDGAAIDQVGIWDRVLSTDEVAELYNDGNGYAYSEWQNGITPVPSISENYIVANDSGAYEAWPQIAKDSTGKLYIVYRTAASNTHMYESTGKVVMKISNDGGVTWGSEIVVADERDIDDRNMVILIFDDEGVETILVPYNTYNASLQSDVYVRKALISNPTVWSDKIHVSYNITNGRARGNPRLLSNGKILIPWQSTNGSTWIGESSDGGLTWTNYVLSSTYTQETSIMEVKTNGVYEGKVIAFIRRSTAPYGYYKTTSLDYGHTWSALTVEDVIVTNYPTPCEMLRWSESIILCVTSHTNKIVLYKSIDEGLTFTYLGYISQPPTTPATYYPSIVKLLEDRIGVAWCENDSDSDLYFNTSVYPPQI